jgi:hypothetical protein
MTQQQVLGQPVLGQPVLGPVRVAPLPRALSAGRLVSRGQLAVAAVLVVLAAGAIIASARGYGPSLTWWGQAAVALVCATYVAAAGFLLVTVLAAGGPARAAADAPLVVAPLADDELPLYTILVRDPARSGAHPGALPEGLAALDYPRTQVLLTGPAAADRDAGLELAEGEFLVVYDTGDEPPPGQLRDAVAAFRQLPAWTVCLQAQLSYENPRNWLAQCFAAEYAVSFGLFPRGLDRLGFVIPLSSTSHHFRTDALQRIGGWDRDNASEGTDLGVRIARRGWRVRALPGQTSKHVTGTIAGWFRQRVQWTAGYLQTWLVHMRSPGRLWRDVGTKRFLGLQLTFALNLAALVNPLLWALAVAYLVTGRSEAALVAGVAAMLAGNLLMVYTLMIGCLDHGLFRAVRTMLLVPVYWALMSVAAYRALAEVVR